MHKLIEQDKYSKNLRFSVSVQE